MRKHTKISCIALSIHFFQRFTTQNFLQNRMIFANSSKFHFFHLISSSPSDNYAILQLESIKEARIMSVGEGDAGGRKPAQFSDTHVGSPCRCGEGAPLYLQERGFKVNYTKQMVLTEQ